MITFKYEDLARVIKEQYEEYTSEPLESLANHIYEVGSLGYDLVLARKFKKNPKRKFFIIIPEVLNGLHSEYVRVLIESGDGTTRLTEDNNYLLHKNGEFVTISKVSEKRINEVFHIE